MMPSEEQFRVDVTSPYISMLFLALELIIITGITWIIIGYMDSDKAAWFLDTNIQNLMVGIWAALALWRFVLPTIRLRNRRIMVNDERIIIHSATLRPTTHTIPLKSIRAVNRKRNELILTVIPAAAGGAPRCRIQPASTRRNVGGNNPHPGAPGTGQLFLGPFVPFRLGATNTHNACDCEAGRRHSRQCHHTVIP